MISRRNMSRSGIFFKVFIIFLFASFLIYPLQSASAFWPFKKKPNQVPSDELTLILDAASKSLVEELGGSGRVSNYCEAVIMELALGGMLELVSKNPIDNAKKTFINIQKTILAGMGKEGADIIIAMTKKAFEEQMEDRQQKSKEKDEKVVLSRKNTNTGCDYTMTVDWLKKEIKKEKRVHVLMEGDCHCKPQLESKVPLSKFKTEFDIEYYYEVMEYEVEGQTQKAYGVFGGLKKRDEPYKFPLDKICQSWYQGRDVKGAECGCKNGEPVKEVSAGPGIIKPDSSFAFLDAAAEKIGMFFAFGPQRKTEKALGYADEKLAEMKEMALKNSPDAFLFAGGKYLDLMKRIDNMAVVIDNGGSAKNDLAALVEESMLSHQSFLLKIIDDARGWPIEPIVEKFITDSKGVIRWKEGDILTPKYADPGNDKNKPEAVVTPEKVEEKKPVDKKPAEESKPKPPVAPPIPIEKPSAQLDETPPPVDVCGDGIVTGAEICDNNSFSQMCLDSVSEYKIGMGNPNLVPRCFNNCRGCEAAPS